MTPVLSCKIEEQQKSPGENIHQRIPGKLRFYIVVSGKERTQDNEKKYRYYKTKNRKQKENPPDPFLFSGEYNIKGKNTDDDQQKIVFHKSKDFLTCCTDQRNPCSYSPEKFKLFQGGKSFLQIYVTGKKTEDQGNL